MSTKIHMLKLKLGRNQWIAIQKCTFCSEFSTCKTQRRHLDMERASNYIPLWTRAWTRSRSTVTTLGWRAGAGSMPTVAISVTISSPELWTIHQILAATECLLFCNNVYYKETYILYSNDHIVFTEWFCHQFKNV
jgi:hypothetical protein